MQVLEFLKEELAIEGNTKHANKTHDQNHKISPNNIDKIKHSEINNKNSNCSKNPKS